jgi:drug/metabolite transporter (DMT)-like permease
MLPVLLGLGSSLSWGTADFLAGLASRRSGAAAVVAVAQTSGLALLLVAIAVTGQAAPPPQALALGAIAGACGALGLVLLYRALAVGSMAVVAPLAALGGVVPMLAGLVAGERPGAAVLVALPLALAATALSGCAGAVGSARGAGRALAAAACFGAFFTLILAAGGDGTLWTVASARAAAIPIALATALAGGAVRIGLGVVPLVLAAAGLEVLADIAYAEAGSSGLRTEVSALGSLYPVATVALAMMLLRERPNRRQSAGIAMALGAACLLTRAA